MNYIKWSSDIYCKIVHEAQILASGHSRCLQILYCGYCIQSHHTFGFPVLIFFSNHLIKSIIYYTRFVSKFQFKS